MAKLVTITQVPVLAAAREWSPDQPLPTFGRWWARAPWSPCTAWLPAPPTPCTLLSPGFPQPLLVLFASGFTVNLPPLTKCSGDRAAPPRCCPSVAEQACLAPAAGIQCRPDQGVGRSWWRASVAEVPCLDRQSQGGKGPLGLSDDRAHNDTVL